MGKARPASLGAEPEERPGPKALTRARASPVTGGSSHEAVSRCMNIDYAARRKAPAPPDCPTLAARAWARDGEEVPGGTRPQAYPTALSAGSPEQHTGPRPGAGTRRRAGVDGDGPQPANSADAAAAANDCRGDYRGDCRRGSGRVAFRR